MARLLRSTEDNRRLEEAAKLPLTERNALLAKPLLVVLVDDVGRRLSTLDARRDVRGVGHRAFLADLSGAVHVALKLYPWARVPSHVTPQDSKL